MACFLYCKPPLMIFTVVGTPDFHQVHGYGGCLGIYSQSWGSACRLDATKCSHCPTWAWRKAQAQDTAPQQVCCFIPWSRICCIADPHAAPCLDHLFESRSGCLRRLQPPVALGFWARLDHYTSPVRDALCDPYPVGHPPARCFTAEQALNKKTDIRAEGNRGCTDTSQALYL